jgi:hypothetical protein
LSSEAQPLVNVADSWRPFLNITFAQEQVRIAGVNLAQCWGGARSAGHLTKTQGQLGAREAVAARSAK